MHSPARPTDRARGSIERLTAPATSARTWPRPSPSCCRATIQPPDRRSQRDDRAARRIHFPARTCKHAITAATQSSVTSRILCAFVRHQQRLDRRSGVFASQTPLTCFGLTCQAPRCSQTLGAPSARGCGRSREALASVQVVQITSRRVRLLPAREFSSLRGPSLSLYQRRTVRWLLCGSISRMAVGGCT